MAVANKVTRSRTGKAVRRSISISPDVARRVQALAESQRSSTNRVLEDLVQAGLDAKEAERKRFFEVADRFRAAKDTGEAQAAKEELAKMIFGA